MSRSLKFQIVEQARAIIADESHWARDLNGAGVCAAVTGDLLIASHRDARLEVLAGGLCIATKGVDIIVQCNI